jgi:phosphate transport system substrate-binding protein
MYACNRRVMEQRLSAIIIFWLCAGVLHAQTSPRAVQPQSNIIEWLSPAPVPNRKQTKEEEDAGRKFGRELPTPEILQPALDPALPTYQPRKDIKLSGSLKGAASDTLPSLVKLWIAAFEKYYPNVKIEVPPPYDGNAGAKELVKQTIDFAFISRVLKPEDIRDFQSRFGYPPLSVPISGGSYRHFGFLDALAFFVHKENPIEKLSFEQLDAILSSTHHRGGPAVTRWGQLGLTGDWMDKPIHIYGIKPWDGGEDLIRQKILSFGGRRGEWRDDISFETVFPIAGRVAEDKYGIGYTGLAYVDAGVKMLPLGEKVDGPFYAPTYENVAQFSYPLGRVIFLNINNPPSKSLDPVIAEFLRFILSRQGQQIVLDHAIFLPLREEQVKSSRALFPG